MKKNNDGKNFDEQKGISSKYALCLVDVKNLGARTFSYIIPENMREKIKIGQAVTVPFGRRKQNVIAFITGFSDYLEKGIKAKEIIKIIDRRAVFTMDYLKLLDWIANYYCCDINAVIQAAIPMKFLKENSGKKIKEKTEKYIIFKNEDNKNQRRQIILKKLKDLNGEYPLIEFEKEVKTTRATILKLKDEGYIDIIEKAQTGYRYGYSKFMSSIPSEEYYKTIEILDNAIEENE